MLEDVWSAVSGGARQAVFVGGEPGAGKTRLLAEAATVLAEHDVAVLLGTSAAEYGVPYQPFVEMLEHLLAANPPGSLDQVLDDTAGELVRLAPELARHLPEVQAGDEPTDLRREFFDSTAHLLRALTTERPVVLVLDDLQWAAAPTLALLGHVVSNIVDARLLILAAFRTTDPDRSDELAEAIADLYRFEGVRRIDLAGLDTDDIAEYLVREGGATLPAARKSAVMLRDQTGGNPFFLRELWRDLRHRGGLPALRSGRVPAPRSVGDTLERRLAGLSPAVRDVIEVAAVIGDVCEVATVTDASGAEPTRVLAAIDAAAAIGLLEPAADDSGEYAFVHALSRQVVLDRLPRSRLAELHARAAAALEPWGTEPQVVPRLAHHYLHCHFLGYGGPAAHYAAESARLAERSLAFEEAASWFERAAAVPDVDVGQRTELLFSAADNHVRAGGFAQARAIYEQLATSGAPATRLTAAMGYENASWRPGRTGSRPADLLATALEAVELDANDPTYIGALASLGRALAFAGEAVRARQVGERAVDLARRHGDESLQSHALCTSLWHGLAPDQAEIQLARATEVAERSRVVRDPELLGHAALFRSLASYVLGRPDELEASVRELHRAADTSGQPFFGYIAGCVDQGRSFLRGDFAAATRQAEDLVELGEAFGTDDVEGSFGLHKFMIERETGRLESVRSLVSGDEPFRGHWVPGLLALYTELGLEAGMRRTLRHVLATLSDERTASAQWPAEIAFLTEAALALQDRDAIDRLHPYLAQYEGRNLVAGEFVATFGAADRYLARTAALVGDHDRADQLFRSALAMDETMGSVVHITETSLHYGRYLLASGDDARAWPVLDRARELAERIGQMRVLSAVPSRPGDGPDGLSERELEVLRLLATGLSNREIGARLFISGNTAANHVRSILMKTGAANRTQAARYAADHQLT
jgi:DNA-binding CsgD family transcriptional regulator